MTDRQTPDSGDSRAEVKLPTQHQLKINLVKLHSKSYAGVSVADAIEEANKLIGTVFEPAAFFSETFDLYRARIDLNPGEELKAASFYNPPANNARLGRANIVGNPVFYGSFDPATPCLELNAKSGDPIWVAAFVKEKNVNLAVRDFSIPHPYRPSESNPQHQATEQLVHQLVTDVHPDLFTLHTSEHLLEAIRAYSYIFVMDNYELSSRIAHYWIHNTDRQVPAIMYSSNMNNLKLNMAIRPAVLRQYFNLESVYRCRYDNDRRLLIVDELGKPAGQDKSVIQWRSSVTAADIQHIETKFYNAHVIRKSRIPHPLGSTGSVAFNSSTQRDQMEEFVARMGSYNDAYDLEFSFRQMSDAGN